MMSARAALLASPLAAASVALGTAAPPASSTAPPPKSPVAGGAGAGVAASVDRGVPNSIHDGGPGARIVANSDGPGGSGGSGGGGGGSGGGGSTTPSVTPRALVSGTPSGSMAARGAALAAASAAGSTVSGVPARGSGSSAGAPFSSLAADLGTTGVRGGGSSSHGRGPSVGPAKTPESMAEIARRARPPPGQAPVSHHHPVVGTSGSLGPNPMLAGVVPPRTPMPSSSSLGVLRGSSTTRPLASTATPHAPRAGKGSGPAGSGSGSGTFFLNRAPVALDSATGKQLLERKSIHADAAEERRDEVVATILGRLEQEERMEEAVKQLHSIKTKVYVCELCKYRLEKRRPICTEANHVVTMIETEKYFWQCTSCHSKQTIIGHARKPYNCCNSCGNSSWVESTPYNVHHRKDEDEFVAVQPEIKSLRYG